ncbi:unnamed protein product [Arctia plantaginis]|uniref:Myrosinase 1-like n=1 Tax=Arctia plantaginis TaxID=874455 RepID=A0A8S1B008_ARCPL|nr:unnamed protein product [Arctia plantaginis]
MMAYISVIVLSVSICGSLAMEYKFPEGFKFGVASAAYQVEGDPKSSDRGENIWDYMVHSRPEVISDRSDASMACDSYHLWRRDIEMMEELGVNMYRFSISWTRLLPTGYPNIISEDGKRFYNDLIDGLLEKGIEPIVTLYHCDLPQSLQDLGGWANPLVVDWFTDYANVVFSLYADRVKIWLTLNEPFGICDFGYMELAAPYFDDIKVGGYMCTKNTLIAHAKAYRLYDEVYRPKYHGKVSLSTLFFWFEPATPDDVEATELAIQFWAGRYDHPIFSKEGGWPKKLEKLMLENGKNEGYPYPRLPPLSLEEIELVKGTYDFYGLNHYTTRLIRKVEPGYKPGPYPLMTLDEINVEMIGHPDWKSTELNWFSVHPKGIRDQLNWLKNNYDLKEIIITENGMMSLDPSLVDTGRLEYIRDYMEQVMLAMQDGVPVTGYTVWTMMDNFEWLNGYNLKYGLYAVDFNSPNRTRTPRESARFYSSVVRSRTLRTTYDNLNVIL